MILWDTMEPYTQTILLNAYITSKGYVEMWMMMFTLPCV